MDSNVAILPVDIGRTLNDFFREVGFQNSTYRLNDTLLQQQQNYLLQAVDFQCFWHHCLLCLCKLREYLRKFLYLLF